MFYARRRRWPEAAGGGGGGVAAAGPAAAAAAAAAAAGSGRQEGAAAAVMLEEEGSAAAAVPRAQANAAPLCARARSPPGGRLEGPAQATARPLPAAGSPPARGQGGRGMAAFGRGKHARRKKPGQAHHPCHRLTRSDKRLGHKAWRVWWKTSRKQARQNLKESAPQKRGIAVTLLEHPNSTQLRFAEPLKYDAVLAWLKRVTKDRCLFEIRREPVEEEEEEEEEAMVDIQEKEEEETMAGAPAAPRQPAEAPRPSPGLWGKAMQPAEGALSAKKKGRAPSAAHSISAAARRVVPFQQAS